MSDAADEIVRRMQDMRREVGEDVRDIVQTAKTLSDWRYYVKNHPLACLAAAAALGFVIAPRKRSKATPDMEELAALLKRYNVNVAAPRQEGRGLAKTLVGMAAPIVMRSVMAAAQHRFGGSGSPLSSFFAGPREEPVPESIYPPR